MNIERARYVDVLSEELFDMRGKECCPALAAAFKSGTTTDDDGRRQPFTLHLENMRRGQ